ncbi:putative molybdenum carrier [Methyloligella halotolerans]|uniref:Putative molybdenum carrier n=1 Tax=Methyloligella halotolerans TaxID=1177755 RepID=A0A1E2S2U5_9HYPH|nr:putative molybdenum carrier protein [Methyloligella halotolerans]ODA68732.1 putative molybdenum carrier [Methyloligella halotolerans]
MALIITGGQTGVDRAALDVALEDDIDYGGWCPHGGWAEDMTEPPGLLSAYPKLRETPSDDPAQRTEWNVRDSDAVLIITDGAGTESSKGSKRAEDFAEKYGKPLMVMNVEDEDDVERAEIWLTELLTAHTVDQDFQLGIGGPRESEAPGIYEKAKNVLPGLLEAL